MKLKFSHTKKQIEAGCDEAGRGCLSGPVVAGAVILKKGFKHELMYPTHSYMDPTYTLSVPRNYTAYGVVDLITHCLEAWFGESDTSLCDRFDRGPAG